MRLDALADIAAERTEEERDAQAVVDEEVFKQVFIPRRLAEVEKPHIDIQQIKNTGGDALNYGAVTGVSHVNNQSGEEEDEGSSDDESEVVEEKREKFVSSARPKNEDKEEKKRKEEGDPGGKGGQKKDKIPKHLKKRKEHAG